jgi:DNA replication protein DnaD
MKAHVIVKKGYEYDDNIYSESEGGNPELICFSKEDADKKVNELNKQEFKTTSLSYYSYDLEDILNVDVEEYENFNKSLIEKYGKINKKNIWDHSENILHPMANDEETEQYMEMVALSFYEVKPTDIDVQSFRDYKIDEVLK